MGPTIEKIHDSALGCSCAGPVDSDFTLLRHAARRASGTPWRNFHVIILCGSLLLSANSQLPRAQFVKPGRDVYIGAEADFTSKLETGPYAHPQDEWCEMMRGDKLLDLGCLAPHRIRI